MATSEIKVKGIIVKFCHLLLLKEARVWFLIFLMKTEQKAKHIYKSSRVLVKRSFLLYGNRNNCQACDIVMLIHICFQNLIGVYYKSSVSNISQYLQ